MALLPYLGRGRANEVDSHEDVADLGNKGGGHYHRPRWYASGTILVPRSFAVKATDGALREADRLRVAREGRHRGPPVKRQQGYAQSLTGTRVVVAARAGDEGKLFGSIGEGDIAAAY